MRSPSSLHPTLRSVLVLALVATFGACGGGDGPLDPASESTTDSAAESAASSSVPTDGLAALTTSQRIAFVSWAGARSVFKVDPQGSQRAPIYAQSDAVDSPAWSWDNKRVAMVRARWSNGVWHNDIFVMTADGTSGSWARSQASVWHITDPAWSPNGLRIVVTILVGGVPTLGWIEPGTSKAGLLWFPGGGAVRGSRPSYNKAGTKILYVGEHFNTIEQINPDGSGHKVRISASVKIDYPSFSPDGARIAYEKGPAPGTANTDIYVTSFTTGVTTRLTSSTAVDGHPSWSPDGIRLAFMSERTGKPQIYTMNAATGGDLLRLSKLDAYEDHPAWTH